MGDNGTGGDYCAAPNDPSGQDQRSLVDDGEVAYFHFAIPGGEFRGVDVMVGGDDGGHENYDVAADDAPASSVKS